MHDLALMAAQEWARTNTHTGADPVKFGNSVALAYLACRDTAYHSGDKAATAAALSSHSLVMSAREMKAEIVAAFEADARKQAATLTADELAIWMMSHRPHFASDGDWVRAMTSIEWDEYVQSPEGRAELSASLPVAREFVESARPSPTSLDTGSIPAAGQKGLVCD